MKKLDAKRREQQGLSRAIHGYIGVAEKTLTAFSTLLATRPPLGPGNEMQMETIDLLQHYSLALRDQITDKRFVNEIKYNSMYDRQADARAKVRVLWLVEVIVGVRVDSVAPTTDCKSVV
jgi:hypothetical protein